MPHDITSPSNEKIKRLIRLRDRRHRDEEGVFVVEGQRLLERATAAGLVPLEIYSDAPLATPAGSSLTVAPSALDRASYRKRADGPIAVFSQFETDLGRLDTARQTLILVAEGIEKPGNLGAMLRTAAAVGADAFIGIGHNVDPFNPNTLRASTGALFSVPLAITTLEKAVAWLRAPLVAGHPDAPLTMWDADLSGDVALMVGAEDTGLTDAAREAATILVSIPMSTGVDSLNASATLAVLAYEARRQHTQPPAR